jgi:hypothetical protein
MGFQECIAFTILVPCILSMWLSQLSLCAPMKFTSQWRCHAKSASLSWFISFTVAICLFPCYYRHL